MPVLPSESPPPSSRSQSDQLVTLLAASQHAGSSPPAGLNNSMHPIQSSHFHVFDLLNLQESSSPQDKHLPTPPSFPQHSSSSTSLCSAPLPWVSFPLLVSGPESNNRAPINYLVSWLTLLIILIITMLTKMMITNMMSMLRSASSPHRGEEATTAEPQVERSRDDCCATAHHRIQVKFFTRFLVF